MLTKATVDLVWCQESSWFVTLQAAIADNLDSRGFYLNRPTKKGEHGKFQRLEI
jgi:hypothetical protein